MVATAAVAAAGAARRAGARGQTPAALRERLGELGFLVDGLGLGERAEAFVLAAQVVAEVGLGPVGTLGPKARRAPGDRRPGVEVVVDRCSPVSSAKIAGTAPVGGSVQCGSGGTSPPAGADGLGAPRTRSAGRRRIAAVVAAAAVVGVVLTVVVAARYHRDGARCVKLGRLSKPSSRARAGR